MQHAIKKITTENIVGATDIALVIESGMILNRIKSLFCHP